MKLEGSYTLVASPERTWALLLDPAVLARSIPGCDRLERTAENEYAMRMKLVLASLSGQFEGKVRIADVVPPASYRMVVEGSGRIGFMKGEGVLTLAAEDPGCKVSYQGDASIGGAIANVGQRLFDTTAKLLIKRFFHNLSEAAVETLKSADFR